jgi:hypothetical protein
MNFKLSPIKFSLIASAVLIISPLIAGNTAFAQTAQTTAPNSGAGANDSYNWAGYVASGGGYTSVSGSWTVPTIPSTTSFTGDATWVGIGGVGSNDLIQTGTQAFTNTNGSAISYQAWYEMLPGFSQPITMTVNPGDSITASITEQSPNQWAINLRDNTNAQNFQTVVAYSSSMQSAEWIEEMPSLGSGQFIPLDSFGTVGFSNDSVIKNGQSMNISQAGGQELSMLNGSQQTLATPSALGYDGGSFSVTRTSAVSTSQTPVPGGQRGSRRGMGIQGFGGFTPRQQSQTSGFARQGFFRFRLRLFTSESFRR